MSAISTDTILTQLRWRYATKQFDATKKIPEGTWEDLEAALVLTPSSFGLQPWKFFVLTDSALREPLVPHAWGQRQVAEASHLVVIAARANIDEAYVDDFLADTAQARGLSVGALGGFRSMLLGFLAGMDDAARLAWATKQCYIALGNFMTAAAMAGIDTCPMEGFIPDKVDEILGLPQRGYRTCLMCPAGYRATGDSFAALAKVRWAKDRVIERL